MEPAKLPGYFKKENILAAHSGCEKVREAWAKDEGLRSLQDFHRYLKSSDFMQVSSCFQQTHATYIYECPNIPPSFFYKSKFNCFGL